MKAYKNWLLGCLFLLVAANICRARTINVNLAESGAVLSGYWPEAAAGGRVYVGGSNGSQLDATIIGKTVDLTCYTTGAGSVTITVDGVTKTPNFPKVNQWMTLTVDLGKGGAHSLTVKQAFLGFSFFLDTGTGSVHGPTFSVKGNAPSVGEPPGFGPQYQLSDIANVSPFVQFEGGLSQIGSGGYPPIYYAAGFPDEGVYFTAEATGTISAWVYGSGGSLTVYQDGVNAGTVNIPASDTYQSVGLVVGDGTSHRYGIVTSYPKAPGLFIWSLMTPGGTLSPVPTIPRPRLLTYGDSIDLGYQGTGNNASDAISERLGAALGWAVYNRGIAGTTVHEFPTGDAVSTTESGEARTSEVTSVSAGARGMLIIYGTSDLYQVGGPETTAMFQASYQAMLTNIVGGVPASCPIVCLGILPRIQFSPAAIAPWNAAMQAAIAAVGASNVQYADPTGWGLLQDNGSTAFYSDPAHNTVDGYYPNEQGYGIILDNLLPYFAPAGAPTVTSAISGTVQIAEPIAYQTTASNSPSSFAAGNLPAGLTLNGATGLIAGTPTASGTFTIGLAATNASGTGSEAFTLTIVRPVVTISVTVPAITVNGGEDGEFTLKLSSARTSDLKVNYSIEGSATPGTDYTPLSGVAIIEAGTLRKAIKIKPRGNLNGASSKTVKLKLEPGKVYAVGTNAPVKVEILSGH